MERSLEAVKDVVFTKAITAILRNNVRYKNK